MSIIKEKREKLGLSQSEFAELTGVNFRTLQDYEQGRKPLASVKGEVLYRLSRGLGCSMEELLLESDPRSTEEREKEMQLRVAKYASKIKIEKK